MAEMVIVGIIIAIAAGLGLRTLIRTWRGTDEAGCPGCPGCGDPRQGKSEDPGGGKARSYTARWEVFSGSSPDRLRPAASIHTTRES